MSLHAVAAQVGAVKGGDWAGDVGHPKASGGVNVQKALYALAPHQSICQTSPRQLIKPYSVC